MDPLQFDHNVWWFASLCFVLYSVYQFILYEFFRYHPFVCTLFFLSMMTVFSPFLVWPHLDIYHVFLYVVSSTLFLYVCMVRIVYFDPGHSKVVRNRITRLLHSTATQLLTNFNSPEEDRRGDYFYNKLTAVILYSSLLVHILMFIIIDFVININISNGICGLLLLITIPVPHSVLSPSFHTVFVEINTKTNKVCSH